MDVASLCANLVQIQSENPPGHTEEVIRYLGSHMEDLGVETEIIRNPEGRWNLVGGPRRPSLLLCGHVDVVPASADRWSRDPFSGEIDGGYVWGRGSTDMKGGCAALLTAYEQCLDDGVEPDVGFAFVCDEETGGEMGIRDLLARGSLAPCDCIIAEPTPRLSPCIGQKGLCRISMTFHGEPGHSSLYPEIGVSAVMEAMAFIIRMEQLHERVFPVEPRLQPIIEASGQVLEDLFERPGMGSAIQQIMYNPGMIQGGEKANIVAQLCTLEMDLRLPWGCSPDTLLEEIRSMAPHADMSVMDAFEPTLTPPETRVAGVVCREIERQYGEPAVPILQWAASDARFLRKAGFNVVDYGPGDLHTLHGVDERVSVEDLRNAVEVYDGVIRGYLQ